MPYYCQRYHELRNVYVELGKLAGVTPSRRPVKTAAYQLHRWALSTSGTLATLDDHDFAAVLAKAQGLVEPFRMWKAQHDGASSAWCVQHLREVLQDVRARSGFDPRRLVQLATYCLQHMPNDLRDWILGKHPDLGVSAALSFASRTDAYLL